MKAPPLDPNVARNHPIPQGGSTHCQKASAWPPLAAIGYDRGERLRMSAERQANYGQSSHGLRGDYSRMRADYTVDQDYGAYTEEQQDRWRRLYRRQIELVPGRACDEYL